MGFELEPDGRLHFAPALRLAGFESPLNPLAVAHELFATASEHDGSPASEARGMVRDGFPVSSCRKSPIFVHYIVRVRRSRTSTMGFEPHSLRFRFAHGFTVRFAVLATLRTALRSLIRIPSQSACCCSRVVRNSKRARWDSNPRPSDVFPHHQRCVGIEVRRSILAELRALEPRYASLVKKQSGFGFTVRTDYR